MPMERTEPSTAVGSHATKEKEATMASRENPDPRMILIFARLIFIFAHTRRNWARTKRRHAMLEQICSHLVPYTGSGFSRSTGGVEPGSPPPPAPFCAVWQHADVFEGDWGAKERRFASRWEGWGCASPFAFGTACPTPHTSPWCARAHQPSLQRPTCAPHIPAHGARVNWGVTSVAFENAATDPTRERRNAHSGANRSD